MSIAPVIPDLSSINSVTSFRGATNDAVVASLSTGSVSVGSETSGTSTATNVDLSDRAKATLAKAASEKSAADKLEQLLASLKGTSTNAKGVKDQSRDKSIFDQIHDLGNDLKTDSGSKQSASANVLSGTKLWQQMGAADNLSVLKAGALIYNKSADMERLAKDGGQFASSTEGQVVSDDVAFVLDAHMQIASNITALRDSGNTEQASKLSAALQNGSLKIQDASSVTDLNVKDNKIRLDDNGGGIGGAVVTTSGSSKAEIEKGSAMVLRLGDRGNYLVSW